MINLKDVKKIVALKLEGTEIFLVDISVTKTNVIHIYVDSPKGVTIKECVDISRAVESSYDRDIEDFELQVSTPGLDTPFKVKEQYQKNVGKEVQIVIEGEKPFKAMLLEAKDDSIVVETSQKLKLEGKKKKELVVEQREIEKKNIKEIKVIISFK